MARRRPRRPHYAHRRRLHHGAIDYRGRLFHSRTAMLNLALQLAAALAIPAAVLTYFSAHQNWRTVREAIWVAFGLGFIAAVPIAAAEYVIALPFTGLISIPVFSAIKAFAIAAVPEETGKYLILVFFVLRHQDFSRPVHAIAFATAVSLGFAAIENILYDLEAPDWAATALARGLTALPMHAAAGLVMGYFASLTLAFPPPPKWYRCAHPAGPLIPHPPHYQSCVLSRRHGAILSPPGRWAGRRRGREGV